MKYLIYAAVAVLILWSLFYLARHVLRQLRGTCSGNCQTCGKYEKCAEDVGDKEELGSFRHNKDGQEKD